MCLAKVEKLGFFLHGKANFLSQLAAWIASMGISDCRPFLQRQQHSNESLQKENKVIRDTETRAKDIRTDKQREREKETERKKGRKRTERDRQT